jgi:glycosyltransferase involved in cell wall biosynthesis
VKVAISVIGKFHSFDLAREMHARGSLAGIFTGYPRFKLAAEGLPTQIVHSFPYIQTPYLAFTRRDLLGTRLVRTWEHLSRISFDAYTAARLPQCDVFVGLSGSALRSGMAAKRHGARYVCDRGSSHIRHQNSLLLEEYDRWGVRFDGIDPRVIDREEAEYSEADCITVPSTFALESFAREGVPAPKLRKLPYGVSLSRFAPASPPDPQRFDVLFVGGISLRKGIPYLLQAYRKLEHPCKSLTFAGAWGRAEFALLKKLGLRPEDAKILGHIPQSELKTLMSRSHVMVLPSIEDGFGLVLAQAMACGCVVIASEHTGARDLYSDGEEGYVVAVRDADALAARLQHLADNPETRQEMSYRCVERVRSLGGWRAYGENATRIYQDIVGRNERPTTSAGTIVYEVPG